MKKLAQKHVFHFFSLLCSHGGAARNEKKKVMNTAVVPGTQLFTHFEVVVYLSEVVVYLLFEQRGHQPCKKQVQFGSLDSYASP